MRFSIKATIGQIVNGLSIALFVYLAFILDVPDFLHPLSYLGWILLGLGIILVVLAIATLASNRGAGLIDRGVYGIVRHPMYLGAMMCFLSYVFLLPHWLVLLISAVNVIIVYGFILQGEQQNIAKFGDAYRRYMKTVPRVNLPAGILRRIRSIRHL